MAQIKKDTSLRKAILQAAITGQLEISNVQCAIRETGKELLQRIIAERNAQALAEWEEKEHTDLFAANAAHSKEKANAVRREQIRVLNKKPRTKKPAPIVASEIDADDVPFEIPDDWCWCRLGDVAFVTKLAGFEYSSHIAPNLITEGIPLFKGKNIQNGHLVLEFENYIPKEISNELYRSKLTKKCLLTPYVGTIGNIAIFDGSFEAHLGSNVGKIELFGEFILEEFLLYFFRSDTGLKQLSKHKKATAQESISIESIRDCLFPLPPLAVQKAIVAKLEEVLPLVEIYENAVLQKAELQRELSDKVKKAILQEAVTGQLGISSGQLEISNVQCAIGETGKELLQRIIAERNAQALAEWEEKVKVNAKAKKPAPIVASEIDADDVPFEIPENWCWCRIDDLFAHNSGKALNKSENKEGTELEYITTSNLYWNYFDLDNLRTMLFKDSEIEKCTVRKGDLLVCEGGEVGRTAIWNFDRTICIQNHIHRLRAYEASLNIKFYYYVMFLYKEGKIIDNYAKGIGIKGLSSNALGSIVIPLPPLAVQNAIVAKIQELLPLCEHIEN